VKAAAHPEAAAEAREGQVAVIRVADTREVRELMAEEV
jgi:hypothetical protein